MFKVSVRTERQSEKAGRKLVCVWAKLISPRAIVSSRFKMADKIISVEEIHSLLSRFSSGMNLTGAMGANSPGACSPRITRTCQCSPAAITFRVDWPRALVFMTLMVWKRWYRHLGNHERQVKAQESKVRNETPFQLE